MDYLLKFLILDLLVVAIQSQQSFETWKNWSTCTTSCGQGVQERKRDCSNGRCVQKETRGCQIRPCGTNGTSTDDGPQFKEWQKWSRCSKTCGSGVQERKRECANGRCVQKETKTCRIRSCPGEKSDVWPVWSECSASCGNGVATRTRQCPVGNCLQRQTKTCYLKPCPKGSESNVTYEPWQRWSSCSNTCGSGHRTRIRKCTELDCKETEVGSCRIKPCPGESGIVPGEWEEWGGCSTSCGHGQRKRRRICIVGVCNQTQTQICKVVDCPNGTGAKEYKEWEDWKPCSVSCGVGTQKRLRRCVVGLCQEVMTKTCFNPSCPGKTADNSFLPWKPWSDCSVSCGNGERRRTRNCRPPANCVQTQSQSCFPKRCGGGGTTTSEDSFHSWEEWSACSVTCGRGEETRRRRCKVGSCLETATRTCRRRSCLRDPVSEYGPWEQWSDCSATCGAGEAKRTRSFLDKSNNQEQLKYCNNKRCETKDINKYSRWKAWSGCSVSCDTGIQTRVRFCRIGSCRDSETKPCKEKECVPLNLGEKYGSWQSWGECSATCGFGFTYRKRYCKIGTCEQTSSKTCRLRACPTDYTEWEEWGKCSVTCGSGISRRKRYCTVGSCEEKQQTTCDMEKCGSGWEDWAEWQGCHKSCGGGFDYRIRKCNEQLPSDNCPGDNYDYKRCNTHSCIAGVWGLWSDWGECQVTCGTGTTIRIRICEEGQCDGEGKETKACNTAECIRAHWSKWSKWGGCSVTCGKGEKTRSRNCIGGKQWDDGCLGSLIMNDACVMPDCIKARWSKWSPWRPCSVTCGRGKRNSERICIDGEPNDVGCMGKTFKTTVCSRAKCRQAVWGGWSEWETCTATCGGGTISRTRSCSGGEVGDLGCTREAEQSRPCRTNKCPPSGKWGDWADWTACSVKCGIGTILRTRTCVGDKAFCKGQSTEADICTQEDCVAQWGEWSIWSICSATCSIGLSIRVRNCEGGSIGDEGCRDGGQEFKECKLRDCGEVTEPPKTTKPPASWLPWLDWSACPVTCDSGTQSRSRICSGAGDCNGEPEEARYCNTHECPTPEPEGVGRWSTWQKWGDCPVPCGSGISQRTRTCVEGSIGNGRCSGRRTQHRRCKREDCKWSIWGSFDECSVSCGKGTRRRTRECAEGAMVVTKCLGLWVDVVECEAEPCPFNPNIRCPNIPLMYKSDVLATTKAPYKLGTELTFTCDVGYKARGHRTIVCQGDGRWSGPAPYCAAKTCTRDLIRVTKGQTCHQACATDGDCSEVSRKCLCDGWCGRSCFDSDAECEPLPLPENGYIVGDIRTYGYTVTYGCNDGFILVGTPTRTCRSDGRWSGLAAKCQPYNVPGIAGDVGNTFGESAERVIKGENANVGAWPWQALLMMNRGGIVAKTLQEMMAGGSLINKKWILTAAHILPKLKKANWQKYFVIGLGFTFVPRENTTLPDYVQPYEPDVVVKHSKFNPASFDYDIALIKIGNRLKVHNGVFVVDNDATHGEVVFSMYVKPIALPCISACDIRGKELMDNGIKVREFNSKDCVKYGRNIRSIVKNDVVVTGYGDKSKNTFFNQDVEVPAALQQASLKLLKPEECVEGAKRIRQNYESARYTRRMLCTGTEEGKDACQGDSGGPLIKQVTSKEGDTCWVQLGIISWGLGCANKDEQNVPYPGFYADTSSLMPWVVKTMKNNP